MIVQELANRTGVRPHVIRYYARIGLLHPTRNPENGYHQFGDRDLERLRFIRLAQKVGYTLKNIKAMFVALDKGELSETWIRGTLERRLRIIRQERWELEQIERSIEETLSRSFDVPLRTSDMQGLARWLQSAVSSASRA
jgi:DNA-binding transcriptional MerR regulator